MKDKQTSLKEFINYIKENNLSSVRLLNGLCFNGDFFLDFFNREDIEDIRDITDRAFLGVRNNGIKTLAKFKELRTNYLEHINSKIIETEDNTTQCSTIPFIDRQKYTCWMRPDILKTLEAIEDETSFLETALLEKFERNGVELAKTIPPES